MRRLFVPLILMENIAVEINYKASGGELKGIENLKSELNKDFPIVHVKPRAGTQSGGLFDFILSLTFNESWSAYAKSLVQEIENDFVIDVAKLYIYNKILNSLNKTKTWCDTPPDVMEFSLNFDDVSFHFYGIDEQFTSKLCTVFKKALTLEKIYNPDKTVSAVVIPVYENEGKYYFDPYGGTINDNYGVIWGLEYTFGMKGVFNSETQILTEDSW